MKRTYNINMEYMIKKISYNINLKHIINLLFLQHFSNHNFKNWNFINGLKLLVFRDCQQNFAPNIKGIEQLVSPNVKADVKQQETKERFEKCTFRT